MLYLTNSHNKFKILLNENYFNKKNFDILMKDFNSIILENKNIYEKKEKKEKEIYLNKNNMKYIKNIKLDAFGFTESDIMLFKEAQKKNCYY